MYFKLISKGCWCGVWREEASQKNGVSPNSVQAFTGGHFKRLSISLREIFSSHNEKSFKNAFPIKLGCLYLQSEGKKNTLFFLHFFCLSVYYALLRTDFTQYVCRELSCAARMFSSAVLVFSEIPKPSRRLFWYFRNFRNVPDGRFSVFGNSETFPTIVLVLSEISKASRRLF